MSRMCDYHILMVSFRGGKKRVARALIGTTIRPIGVVRDERSVDLASTDFSVFRCIENGDANKRVITTRSDSVCYPR